MPLLYAALWALTPFMRPPGAQPVIAPDKTHHWEALHTFNPAAIVRNGRIYVLYRAEDDSGEMMIGGHTSRIGLAVSDDGIHFNREPQPVLGPSDDSQKDRETPGGCEDPRIVEAEDGTYVLTYTQWNRKTYDAGVATSLDLHNWTKHGPVFFKAYNGKYRNLQYKSAGIVTRPSANGRLIAAKINGRYWMYWGEGEIHLATSQNLIDWDPVEDAEGALVSVLGKRPGRFDSSFPEVGPPPILTPQGILVIYNGKNANTNAYAAGQALFSASDPAHLESRLDQPFFEPTLPFEKSGQYAAGTTFVEGLVYFKGKWVLYYGCADSLVGVAFCPKRFAAQSSFLMMPLPS